MGTVKDILTHPKYEKKNVEPAYQALETRNSRIHKLTLLKDVEKPLTFGTPRFRRRARGEIFRAKFFHAFQSVSTASRPAELMITAVEPLLPDKFLTQRTFNISCV